MFTLCFQLQLPALPEVLDVGDGLVEDALLAAQPLDLHLEQADVLHPLGVLQLALVQDGLLDLDLLVEQRQLVVTPHQLRAQDVSLADHLRRGETERGREKER